MVRALGGYFSDQVGREIEYDPENKSYSNYEGVLCGFVEKYRQVAVDVYVRYKKDNSKPAL